MKTRFKKRRIKKRTTKKTVDNELKKIEDAYKRRDIEIQTANRAFDRAFSKAIKQLKTYHISSAKKPVMWYGTDLTEQQKKGG